MYRKYTLNSFLALQVQKNVRNSLKTTIPDGAAYFSIPAHYIYSND